MPQKPKIRRSKAVSILESPVFHEKNLAGESIQPMNIGHEKSSSHDWNSVQNSNPIPANDLRPETLQLHRSNNPKTQSTRFEQKLRKRRKLRLPRMPRRFAARGNNPPCEFVHDHPNKDHAADDRKFDVLVLRMDQIDRITEHDDNRRPDYYAGNASLATTERTAA